MYAVIETSHSIARWMSCAALSISAVRMAERGMDTRSDTDESEGVNRSAAEEDRGQSSRQRDTMESTMTWKSTPQFSDSPICHGSGCEKRLLDVPEAPCLQLWQVPQPVSPASGAQAHPQTERVPVHTVKGKAWSRGKWCFQVPV